MKLDFTRMAERAQEAEDLLKCMANKNRLMILCVLAEQAETSVGELNTQVPLSQSVLRETSVVSTHRQSQTIYYRLNDERARDMLQTLYRVFCEH